MSTPVRASDRDLHALARIVSQDHPDLPAEEGLPPSLLADLMNQISCDILSLNGWDAERQTVWFSQEIPPGIDYETLDPAYWALRPTAAVFAEHCSLGAQWIKRQARPCLEPSDSVQSFGLSEVLSLDRCAGYGPPSPGVVSIRRCQRVVWRNAA